MKEYAGRGSAEHRIKQMVLDLKADWSLCSWLAGNQVRLLFSPLAYLLLEQVRKIGPQGKDFAKASLGTLRLSVRVRKVAVCVREHWSRNRELVVRFAVSFFSG